MRIKAFALLTAAFATIGLVAAACGGGDSVQAVPGNGDAGATGGLAALQNGAGGQLQGIAVAGRGVITAEPDTASLSLGVTVFADTVVAARAQAAEAMNDLLESVKGNGVLSDDIRTTQFTINPEFDYSRSGEPRITGYRVTNTVSVKVRNLDSVSDVIDDAVLAVGDPIRIGGISFTVDDPTPFLSQARAVAIGNAQTKAQELADLADVTLGKPFAISESSGGGPSSVFFEAARVAGDNAVTPIQPGQLELTVNVQVVYAIQ